MFVAPAVPPAPVLVVPALPVEPAAPGLSPHAPMSSAKVRGTVEPQRQ